MSSRTYARPGVLTQLLVLVLGLTAVACGLYGGVVAALIAWWLPFALAGLVAVVAWRFGPDDVWSAQEPWKALCLAGLLLAACGVVRLVLPAAFVG